MDSEKKSTETILRLIQSTILCNHFFFLKTKQKIYHWSASPSCVYIFFLPSWNICIFDEIVFIETLKIYVFVTWCTLWFNDFSAKYHMEVMEVENDHNI